MEASNQSLMSALWGTQRYLVGIHSPLYKYARSADLSKHEGVKGDSCQPNKLTNI